MSEVWQRRAARARALAARYPVSEQILTFYAGLAEWQAEARSSAADLRDLGGVFPSLLELVRRTGPRPLAMAAERLNAADCERLVQQYYRQDLAEPNTLEFFARAILQPHAATTPQGLDCPWCSRPPQVGLLRSQADGLAFDVVCALCLRRRAHSRQRCPGCQESSSDQLVNFSTPEFSHLRLKACDACRGYLSVVDLSKEPKAIPEVDELAAGPLDLWALEHGYHKLQPNIVGL